MIVFIVQVDDFDPIRIDPERHPPVPSDSQAQVPWLSERSWSLQRKPVVKKGLCHNYSQMVAILA